jgi:hypothetical protein
MFQGMSRILGRQGVGAGAAVVRERFWEFGLATRWPHTRIGCVKTGRAQQFKQFPGTARLPRRAAWLARNFSVVALPILLLCGCSTFNRDWEKAAQQPKAPDSIEGCWEGKWLSDVNGHTGRLRCLLSRESDSCYQARFRATYWKVFRFSYTVPLRFEQRDGIWHFTGEENLGKLAGGVYRYEGHATRTNFFSTYRSKPDHGTFQMQRPE